jgi:hypothetical protein
LISWFSFFKISSIMPIFCWNLVISTFHDVNPCSCQFAKLCF